MQTTFDFAIYPNPNNGLFKIVFDGKLKGSTWQVNTINLLGENVHAQNFLDTKNIELDLRNIAAGVYFVSLNDGVNTLQKRVVITK
jgi:hypothetical protein